MRRIAAGALLAIFACGGENRGDGGLFGGSQGPPGMPGADRPNADPTGDDGSTGAGGAQEDSSSEPDDENNGSDSNDGGFPDDNPVPDLGGGLAEPQAVVYAHTNRDLYRLDPDTLDVIHVGAFGFPEGINQMTDIAIDRDERMLGVSTSRIYEVNTVTADCTSLAELDRPYNGLSFISESEGPERLIGATQDGWLYEIDPQTGASSPIGEYGDAVVSSGDVVSVEGLTLATTTRNDWGTDRLMTIDPQTGLASAPQDTGATRLYGLGFWGGEVFGFSETGEIVVIDVASGEATVAKETSLSWWGAGVTTSAPLTPEG